MVFVDHEAISDEDEDVNRSIKFAVVLFTVSVEVDDSARVRRGRLQTMDSVAW